MIAGTATTTSNGTPASAGRPMEIARASASTAMAPTPAHSRKTTAVFGSAGTDWWLIEVTASSTSAPKRPRVSHVGTTARNAVLGAKNAVSTTSSAAIAPSCGAARHATHARSAADAPSTAATTRQTTSHQARSVRRTCRPSAAIQNATIRIRLVRARVSAPLASAGLPATRTLRSNTLRLPCPCGIQPDVVEIVVGGDRDADPTGGAQRRRE